jgi:hypothetical protein
MRFNRSARAGTLALAALCGALAGALPTSAQTTVPYNFSAGSPAKAGEVNANFQALATAINALSARLDKAEGKLTAADIVGTYRFQSLQPQIGTGPYVRFDTYDGTLAFRADGTLSFNLDSTGTQLSITGGSANPVTGTLRGTSGSDTGSATWSLSGTTLSMGPQRFYVADGGRLMVHASTNPSDSTTKLILLIRTN